MPSSAVLYDPESAAWLRFGNLVEEIEVLTPDQVLPAIDALDKRVEKEGLYAAGFISYEAAAAFDEALQTRSREDFPLLRFGLLEGTCLPLETARSTTLKLRFALSPVDSRDPQLYHKTTRRGIYETALSEAGNADEVVLWNERGEVTECCTANLVIEKNGVLITSPVTCGLLPGTYREFLVRRGLIGEKVISREELQKSPRIYLVNAVRKWRKAELLPD